MREAEGLRQRKAREAQDAVGKGAGPDWRSEFLGKQVCGSGRTEGYEGPVGHQGFYYWKEGPLRSSHPSPSLKHEETEAQSGQGTPASRGVARSP